MRRRMQVTDLMSTFGHNVRARRLKLGLTQAQLAERLGMFRTYIVEVEQGRRSMLFKTLVQFADALETTPSALLSTKPEKIRA